MGPSSKPARRKPGIPYTTQVLIIQWLVRGDPTAGQPGPALRRELHMLKDLLKVYPDSRFWLSLRPPLILDSLCFFKSQSGAQELEKSWRLYRFDKNQSATLQKGIDTSWNIPTMESELSFVERATPPPVKRKVSALEWADSTEQDAQDSTP